MKILIAMCWCDANTLAQRAVDEGHAQGRVRASSRGIFHIPALSTSFNCNGLPDPVSVWAGCIRPSTWSLRSYGQGRPLVEK